MTEIDEEMATVLAGMMEQRAVMKKLEAEADILYSKYEIVSEQVCIATKLLANLNKQFHILIDARAANG